MLFDLPLVQLLFLSFYGIIQVMFEPFFFMVIFMVYWQCKRVYDQQQDAFGFGSAPLWRIVLEAIGIGFIGGVFASMLVLIVGLPINNIGIQYIWPIAIFLMLINLRFLCFSYAGAIIALSNILFGWPNVSASHVLALVGILHATESLLVLIGGKFSSYPIYLKLKGRAVGAFMLTNLWPLPFLLLFSITLPDAGTIEQLKMPDWWPLFPLSELENDDSSMLMPIPVMGILGYSSITIAYSAKVKRSFSALFLFIYSLVLLYISYLSLDNLYFLMLAAFFAILGHEAIVHIDQKMEMRKKPIYTYDADNFIIFSTVYNSPAYMAGVKSGDILLKLNGNDIKTEKDLALVCWYLPKKFTIEVLRKGKVKILYGEFLKSSEKILGIIRMPVTGRDNTMIMDTNYSFLLKWYNKYIKKHK